MRTVFRHEARPAGFDGGKGREAPLQQGDGRRTGIAPIVADWLAGFEAHARLCGPLALQCGKPICLCHPSTPDHNVAGPADPPTVPTS